MLATGSALDLGDAVANGIALFAAVMSIVALFFANSRAKEANEIALDAIKTSREARDIAKSAHQRTVEHYEHIESQDLKRLQAEFKELTTPHLEEMAHLMAASGINPIKPNNKLVNLEYMYRLVKSVYRYTFTVMQKINSDQVSHFLSVTQEINDTHEAYIEAHEAFFQEYESHLADVEQASVDDDPTGRLRVAKDNLSTIIETYYELVFIINYAEDYREEMNRIPMILKSIREDD